MTKPDITVLCNMAGTASALMPVLRDLRKRYDVQVLVESTGMAREKFSKSDIPFSIVKERQSLPLEGRVLLTGATPVQMDGGKPKNYSREPEAWKLASELEIPSFALLDKYTPSESRARFTDVKTGELIFPETVLLPHDYSKGAMINDFGIVLRSNLSITGNPAFDDIPERVKTAKRVYSERIVPVFLSSQLYMRQNGTDNLELLEAVCKSVGNLGTVIVKAHPKDTDDEKESYRRLLVTLRNGTLDTTSDSEELALSLRENELCVGASSMLLEFATLADKLAVVAQIGSGQINDAYIANVLNVVPAARSTGTISGVISVLLTDSPSRTEWAEKRKNCKEFQTDFKATERVVKSIEQYL